MDLDTLRAEFCKAGLGDRDLLVHSSLSSLGHVEGGAATVVRALVDVVAQSHTLLFPTHTWVLASQPGVLQFDVRLTPVMAVGAIPEAARLFAGGRRSIHATHSVVAFGPRALRYVQGHEDCATPCGPGSPYYRLAERGGEILLLGCDHHSNTSIHMIEEILELPGTLDTESRDARLTDSHGEVLPRKTRMHSFAERDFMRVDAMMSALGIQRIVRIGEATARIVDARRQRDWLLSELRQYPRWLLA